jgi:hypothetical protein
MVKMFLDGNQWGALLGENVTGKELRASDIP